MKNSKSSELNILYNEYGAAAEEAFPGVTGGRFVWGDGDPDSPVVMIGEAPGKDEIAEGRPFVGKAGKMLNEFLAGAGLARPSLFITNTVKYRLSRPGKKPGTLANRPIKGAELAFSAPYLRRELEILRPAFVVTLGNVPLRAVSLAFGLETGTVGEAHGRPVPLFEGKMTLFPIYHPASLIYNNSLVPEYQKDLSFFSENFSDFFEKKC